VSLDSRLHSVLKHGFGYDSGPRFDGTRHNVHREAIKPTLAALSNAVQDRQAHREAAAVHREGMRSVFAELPGSVQERQAHREAAAVHREGMKSVFAELPGSVQERQAHREAATAHREGMKSVFAELPGSVQERQAHREAAAVHREGMKPVFAELRAKEVHKHFSSLASANKQLSFGRQQAQKSGRFGLASFRRGMATIGSHVAYSLGFKGLSYSEARAATDRAVQAKKDLHSGANDSALDYSTSPDGKQTDKRANSLKSSFPALENALLAGPGKLHQQSQEIYNDVGSRALLKAEERTSSIIEGVRSTQAGVARGALRVLDSEERPKLRSVAKFFGLYQAAFKSSFRDQHTELASQIEGMVREAKGYASEAYTKQARADVAETVGDVFRTGAKGLGYANKIVPSAEGKIAKYSLQGAGGIASLFQAGFSYQASKRFETASNQTYRNGLMSAFFGAKHHENKEGARIGTIQGVKTGLRTGVSVAGDASGLKEKAQDALGLKREAGEASHNFSEDGVKRAALSSGQKKVQNQLADSSLKAGRWGLRKLFSSKRIDRNEGMRGYLNAGKDAVRKANRADAANVAALMASGVGRQNKPRLTRQNARRNLQIDAD